MGSRRKNPDGLLLPILLIGGAGALYFLTRKSEAAEVPAAPAQKEKKKTKGKLPVGLLPGLLPMLAPLAVPALVAAGVLAAIAGSVATFKTLKKVQKKKKQAKMMRMQSAELLESFKEINGDIAKAKQSNAEILTALINAKEQSGIDASANKAELVELQTGQGKIYEPKVIETTEEVPVEETQEEGATGDLGKWKTPKWMKKMIKVNPAVIAAKYFTPAGAIHAVMERKKTTKIVKKRKIELADAQQKYDTATAELQREIDRNDRLTAEAAQMQEQAQSETSGFGIQSRPTVRFF